MNKKFIEYIKTKPFPYQESTKAFWDDENISKYMLEAHLNPDWDAASRKHDTIIKSVDWIDGYCGGGKGKKLLDLGCGPGLYDDLFADKGFRVTGIDFSRRSIAYAKENAKQKNKDIEYHYQNYLDIDYNEEFDVVTLIYCDFGVLSPENRQILLKKIYRALKPGGIFIFDAHTKPYLDTFQEIQTINYEDKGFWSDKPHVVIQKSEYYKETANTLDQYVVVTDTDCECYYIWNQIYTRESATHEIMKAGFKNPDCFDDITGKEYTDKMTTLCLIARK